MDLLWDMIQAVDVFFAPDVEEKWWDCEGYIPGAPLTLLRIYVGRFLGSENIWTMVSKSPK